MKIVVLVKEVPDTYEDRRLHPETGLADRGANAPVLDEIGERALEVALAYADDHPETEVIVLSMGPSSAVSTARKALAIGGDRAVHVVDDDLCGADLGLTARTLSAALERIGFDCAIAGNQSTDGSAGMVPAMVAEILDAAHISGLDSVELDETGVAGSRTTHGGVMRVAADLPAVISVTERVPEARFPSTRASMAAKRKPLETVTLADLGVDADSTATPGSIMVAVRELPQRAAGVTVVDDGDAAEKLADFLVEQRLA